MDFTAEPILAWRKWQVSTADGILRSLMKDTEWRPGKRFDARCLKRSGHLITTGSTCSQAPQLKCTCGVYAVKESSEVVRFGATMRAPNWYDRHVLINVVGQVSLWGHVIEHEKGFRAQHAYPYSLQVIVPARHPAAPAEREAAEAVAAKMRDHYMVDVEVIDARPVDPKTLRPVD